jgi:phage terminase large subunit-like protein
MVELDPALCDRVQVFQDHQLEPHTDSTLFALPADPGALQGWDPSLGIVDELHGDPPLLRSSDLYCARGGSGKELAP